MSLQIGKVRNIPIKLHFTLFIVFVLVAWTLSRGFMPTLFPYLPNSNYLIMGISGAIILFVSVLLHELAHSILSLRYGLAVRQIILFIFGGISDIKQETRDYGKEFKIAVVGPITSFALAGGFALVWLVALQIAGPAAFPSSSSFDVDNMETTAPPINNEPYLERGDINFQLVRTLSGILLYSSIVNAIIGSFNLLPAFPLDGGRMLRAGLVRWKKSFDDATRIAVKVGVGISYGLMGLGFITIVSGSFVGGIWLIFIGWFLQSGAQSYLQQNELSSVLYPVRLKDMMNEHFISVNANQSVEDTLRNYFNVYRKSEFPVVDDQGMLVGAITSKAIMNISDNLEKNVQDIMTPLKNLIIMGPDKRADEGLKRIYSENKSRIFVCEDAIDTKVEEKSKESISELDFATIQGKRRLLGIISKTDILNIAAESKEYEKIKKNLR